MLTRLKKMVAVMALFATVMTQASIAGAFSLSDSGSSGSTSTGSSAAPTSAADYCKVYGCTSGNGTGSTGTTGGTSGSTGGSAGSSSDPCATYGNCGGSTGSTGATAANPTSAADYCKVYGCSSGSGTGSTGSTGSTGNGSAQPAKPASDPCHEYTPCNGSNGGTPATHATNPCIEYTPCEKQTPAPGPQQPGFSACNNHVYPNDIDGHWAEIYIRRLYDLCIFEGYADGSFRPDQNITRAEVVKTALYAAGITPDPGCWNASCGSPYNDLDMWQGQWLRPAWKRGIVQGYGDGTFRPDRYITRAEATKIILAAFGYTPDSTDRSFFNDVSGWSTGWIEKAHDMGIVSGIGNGNFDPNRPITRAEVAKIVAKTLEKWDTHIANNNVPYPLQACDPGLSGPAWQQCMHGLYPNQY